MLILVTRPEPQATEWAQGLQALGQAAQALPLIDIEGPAHPEAVAHAWQQLPSVRLVVFVSPNAAHWFARQRPSGCTWPANTLAAAPGPGTARAVLQLLAPVGLQAPQLVSPPAESAQFDSEHLWPLLASLDWAGQRVLVISGGDEQAPQGRAWLAQQLNHAGAQTDAVLTYQRRTAHWSPEQRASAQLAYDQPAQHGWLFSSSEAIDHLLELMGPPPTTAQALVTHPRVADKARLCGFASVWETSPTVISVAQTAAHAVAQVRRSGSLPQP